jgi:Mg-chelatase subunit ChlD
LVLGLLSAAWIARPATAGPTLSLDEIYTACRGDNPYFAAAVLPAQDGSESVVGAVTAFQDTPDEVGVSHAALANLDDVGAAYGLAYDWRRGQLYVAAYHRRGQSFGAGGPGQIYRIDLGSGAIEPWVRMDAGLDRHGVASSDDAEAAEWVGKTGIGDIEIDDNGLNLFAVNMATGMIHRYSVPDGRLLGVFPSGGSGETWSAQARVFGLAFHAGRLYHGVVNSREGASAVGPFEAVVYRTRVDGSVPVRVADLELDYARSPGWTSWSALSDVDGDRGQPMLVDIEFRPNGDMMLGLRDRTVDMQRNVRPGSGDILGASAAGGTWLVQTEPEHYADDWTRDESALGSIAALPGFDGAVIAAAAPIEPSGAGAVYLYNVTGQVIARERLLEGDGAPPGMASTIGDIEVLCGPPGAMTATPTVTPSPTPTATPTPAPAYLPLLLGERCPPLKVDVVMAIDLSTSMEGETADGRRKLSAAVAAAGAFGELLALTPGQDPTDRAAVVGFNSSAWVALPLTDDGDAIAGALAGLADEVEPGTRLDLAIARSSEVLGEARNDALRVLVLLTDGKPTNVPAAEDGSPETTVLDAAARLRRDGVHVFTIGLGDGDDVDPQLLAAIAGSVGRYVQAPGAGELAAIYEALASDIRCPPGRHDWSRRWP